MTTCRRGDVVLALFPNSDLKTAKKRPALIVQADDIDTGIAQRVCALITSNMSRTGKTRVVVAKDSDLGRQMGILTDSVVVADNLATIPDYGIDRVIGNCRGTCAVDEALRTALSL